MSQSHWYRVHRADGEVVATCKYASDAALLLIALGRGSSVRDVGGTIWAVPVWAVPERGKLSMLDVDAVAMKIIRRQGATVLR